MLVSISRVCHPVGMGKKRGLLLRPTGRPTLATDETRVTREAREIREPEGGAMRTSRPTQVGRDLRARRSFVHSRHSHVSRAKLCRVPSVDKTPLLNSSFPWHGTR